MFFTKNVPFCSLNVTLSVMEPPENGCFSVFRRVSGLSAGKTVFLSVMMAHHDAEQMPRKILFEDGSWHLQTEWQDEEQGSCRNRSGSS